MRVTPLGAILLTFCTVFVLSSVLFMRLSLMVAMLAILTIILYARIRFLSELNSTAYEVRRSILESMIFAGENATVKVEILNKTDRAISASFEDLLPADCELRGGSNKVDRDVAPASVFSFTYSFAALKRGVHVFPGVRVLRDDAFGLFEHEEVVEHLSRANIHTKRQSLEVARRTAGSEHLEYSGFARSPAVIMREFEFDGLRDYDLGDRARDIHWKSSARLGRLMTKVYRKEGALQTMMMVDCSSSMRLAAGPLAKIDHAVDLAIQISDVLLKNMHPSGIGLFDEVHVLDEALPGLGRQQFEKIVTTLRSAPGAVDVQSAPEAAADDHTKDNHFVGTNSNGEKNKAFISAVESIISRKHSGSRVARLGLEGEIARIAATKRSQQKLFIVLTDLTSSRNAILAAAKLCKRTNNKMLVINTYSDWYRPAGDGETRYERMYGSLEESMMTEKVLRKQGVSFLRIGPADTAPRIIRTIRRGLA